MAFKSLQNFNAPEGRENFPALHCLTLLCSLNQLSLKTSQCVCFNETTAWKRSVLASRALHFLAMFVDCWQN